MHYFGSCIVYALFWIVYRVHFLASCIVYALFGSLSCMHFFGSCIVYALFWIVYRVCTFLIVYRVCTFLHRVSCMHFFGSCTVYALFWIVYVCLADTISTLCVHILDTQISQDLQIVLLSVCAYLRYTDLKRSANSTALCVHVLVAQISRAQLRRWCWLISLFHRHSSAYSFHLSLRVWQTPPWRIGCQPYSRAFLLMPALLLPYTLHLTLISVAYHLGLIRTLIYTHAHMHTYTNTLLSGSEHFSPFLAALHLVLISILIHI